jgi:hypothetical protein
MTAFDFLNISIIHFILCKNFQLAKALSFLILSIGSGHDTPITFPFEPLSAIMGLAPFCDGRLKIFSIHIINSEIHSENIF